MPKQWNACGIARESQVHLFVSCDVRLLWLSCTTHNTKLHIFSNKFNLFHAHYTCVKHTWTMDKAGKRTMHSALLLLLLSLIIY